MNNLTTVVAIKIAVLAAMTCIILGAPGAWKWMAFMPLVLCVAPTNTET